MIKALIKFNHCDSNSDCLGSRKCSAGVCKCLNGRSGLLCDQLKCPDQCNQGNFGGTCNEVRFQ